MHLKYYVSNCIIDTWRRAVFYSAFHTISILSRSYVFILLFKFYNYITPNDVYFPCNSIIVISWRKVLFPFLFSIMYLIFQLYHDEWCVLYVSSSIATPLIMVWICFQQCYSYITQNGAYSTFNKFIVITQRMVYVLLSIVF